ncbi:MAG: TonB-dependent receptor plug domain-containing protein, partial [Polymorphobacter sp.]
MRSATSLIRAGLLASIAASTMLVSGTAFAQTAETAQATDEDSDSVIIVTASKRSATLQDTPISVSVTGRAQIEESQIRDLKDLQTLVPSLRVNQLQSSANTNFIIR